QPTDAGVVTFKIDNDNGGAFKASGTGVDYNGAPLCFNLDGTYDQLANLAVAKLSLCDNTRADSFSQKLLEDDTGYFALTKVKNNGGCFAEARLVRKPDDAPKAAPPAAAAPARLASAAAGALF